MNQPSPTPLGPPRLHRVNDPGVVKCPWCECEQTCEMRVVVEAPGYESGRGIGRYTGCPGCGWRSSMDVVTETDE